MLYILFVLNIALFRNITIYTISNNYGEKKKKNYEL